MNARHRLSFHAVMLTELSAVQAPLIRALMGIGYTHITADQVPREDNDVLVEAWVRQAIRRLNPQVQTQEHEDLAWNKALSLVLNSQDLFTANKAFHELLMSKDNFSLPDLPPGEQFFQLRLIDFDDMSNNDYVIVGCAQEGRERDHELSFPRTDDRSRHRRFDGVVFVNGIPLVIIETKSPTEENTSWQDAATDIARYQKTCAPMFVPNLLSVATDGRQLRAGSITTPAERWFPWETQESRALTSSLQKSLLQAQQLLAPQQLLSILQHYVMYYRGAQGPRKIVPRPMQVDAVEKILLRVQDPSRNQGLIFHSQGSGKTFSMTYTASRLHKDHNRFGNPLIVVVVDRKDLLAQTKREFAAVDVQIEEATTIQDLRDKLKKGVGGVIVTTVHRFADIASAMNTSEAILLVDEAHRSQEGMLARGMRNALPNATIIGFTGTPVSDERHNTWDYFGDQTDPDRILSAYTMSDSISDTTTLPLLILPRYISSQIDKIALDAEFDEFINSEEITDEEEETLRRRGAHMRQLFAVPRHIQSVANDIAKHYTQQVMPHGLKAQVVVWDRVLCVKMYKALTSALQDRNISPSQVEVNVVMSGAGSKSIPQEWADRPQEWEQHCPDARKEEELQRRFIDKDDPFRIVIVCNKWLTGFDAPNEGVIYIDRLIKKQTLFQAVCRTNRPYDGKKKYGKVVDYTGTIKKAMVGALDVLDNGTSTTLVDEDEMMRSFDTLLKEVLNEFGFVDRKASDDQQIIQAQNVFTTAGSLSAVSEQLKQLSIIYEELWPNQQLKPHTYNYRWAMKMYHSLRTVFGQDRQDLWNRYGPHVLMIINDHVDAAIRGRWPDGVLLDQSSIQEMLLSATTTLGKTFAPGELVTAQSSMDSLQDRLVEKLASTDCPAIYKSLAERLDSLRKMLVESAEEQEEALHQLVDIYKQFHQASRDTNSTLLLDGRVGGMTQILENYGPRGKGRDVLDGVVYKIDAELGNGLIYKRWKESSGGQKDVRRQIRLILRDYDIYDSRDHNDELVSKLFGYVFENY